MGSRLRYALVSYIGRSPALLQLSSLLLHKRSTLVARAGMDLVLEGYPRSANSFAVLALEQAQSGPLRIAHHMHAEAQILLGLRYRLPILILIREPLGAVSSLLTRNPEISINQALKRYLRFYRTVERVRDRVVLGEFSEITRDYASVIQRLNQHFGTDFKPYRNNPDNDARIFSEIDRLNLYYEGGQTNQLARPSSHRDDLLKLRRDEAQRNPLIREAIDLYRALSPIPSHEYRDSPMKSKPILITGSHRCGSTWLAAMLGAARGTTVLQEPFNIAPHFYSLDGLARYWFTYAPGLDPVTARRAFEKVLKRKAGRVYERRQWPRYLPWLRQGRQIIKDPIAAFSTEWLHDRFDLATIILVRHPAAFAASLKRLSWFFPFEHLRDQPRLLEEVLAPYRGQIENPPTDIVGQASLMWLLIYHALDHFAARHPDWIVIRHEDISLDPISQMSALYARLELDWDDHVKARIREMSDADNPVDPQPGVVHAMRRDSRSNIRRWQHVLTAEEIAHCRAITSPIADKYYDDSDW